MSYGLLLKKDFFNSNWGTVKRFNLKSTKYTAIYRYYHLTNMGPSTLSLGFGLGSGLGLGSGKGLGLGSGSGFCSGTHISISPFYLNFFKKISLREGKAKKISEPLFRFGGEVRFGGIPPHPNPSYTYTLEYGPWLEIQNDFVSLAFRVYFILEYPPVLVLILL